MAREMTVPPYPLGPAARRIAVGHVASPRLTLDTIGRITPATTVASIVGAVFLVTGRRAGR